MVLPVALSRCGLVLAAVLGLCGGSPASAQTEGGLYIAGYGFSFTKAAQQALSQNPAGGRFFLLALPPQTTALTTRASRAQTAMRERVLAAQGVLLVCQRDIDNGRVAAASLAPGVVAVRGWSEGGIGDLSAGQRLFPGENPAQLPASNEALRRLRSTCS